MREQILDAAKKLFAEKGYASVTMRKVASLIGYSPTTIYLHFKNKAEMFKCLIEEMHAEQLDVFESIARRAADPVERLKKLLHAYVDMGVSNPDTYRVSFMLHADPRTTPKDHIPSSQASMALHATFEDCVRQCMDSKKTSPGDVRAAAQAVWVAVHGLASLLITYPGFPWVGVDELKNKVIDSAVASLG